MDETDKAFMHNACKKVAQLGRVTVTLVDSQLDRYAELRNLFEKQDQRVENIEKKYITTLKFLHRDLNKFRKEQTQKVMEEYGHQYKLLKTEFADYVESKNKELTQIEEEYESINGYLKFLNKEYRQKCISLNNAFEEAMKNKPVIPKSNTGELKALRKKLAEIEDEIDYLEYDFEEDMEEIEEDKKAEIKKLKRIIKNTKDNAGKNQIELLKNFKERLRPIKIEVQSFRNEYFHAVQIHEKNMNTNMKTREKHYDGLMSELSGNNSSASNKINSFKVKSEKEKEKIKNILKSKQSEWERERKEHNKIIKRLRADNKASILAKNNDINHQKTAIESIIRDALNQNRSDEDSVRQKMQYNHNELNKLIKEDSVQLSNYKFLFTGIENSLNALAERQKVILQKNESTLISNMENFISDLNETLGKREKNIQASENNAKNERIEKLKKRTQKYQTLIEEENSKFLSQKSKKMNLASVKKDNMELTFEGKLDDTRRKFQAKIEKYKLELESENEDFQNELKTKKESIDIKNKSIIREQINQKQKPASIEHEKKNFVAKKAQMESMKTFIINQVASASKERFDQVYTLDEEINKHIDAKSKQIQKEGPKKFIKTIINEIHSTATSFTKEIESFQATDKLSKAAKQLYKTKVECEEAITAAELELMIKHEENTTKIVEAECEFERFRDAIDSMEREYMDSPEIRGIQAAIKSAENEIEDEKDELKKKWRDKDMKSTNAIRELDMQICAVIKNKETKLEQLEEKFADEIDQLKKKHKVLADRVKNKIEQAKSSLINLIDANKDEIDAFIEEASNVDVKNETEETVVEIEELSNKETELIIKTLSMTDQGTFEKVSQLKSKLVELDKAIKELIEHQIDLIIPKKTESSSRQRARSNLTVLPPLAQPK